MNDNAVSTVQAALASTSWLPVPCPPEYLPALARDVLYALEKAGIATVELPEPEAESPHSWLDGAVTATRGLGRVRLYQEDHRLTSADAREVAAALLAAANAAESVAVAASREES